MPMPKKLLASYEKRWLTQKEEDIAFSEHWEEIQELAPVLPKPKGRIWDSNKRCPICGSILRVISGHRNYWYRWIYDCPNNDYEYADFLKGD